MIFTMPYLKRHALLGLFKFVRESRCPFNEYNVLPDAKVITLRKVINVCQQPEAFVWKHTGQIHIHTDMCVCVCMCVHLHG